MTHLLSAISSFASSKRVTFSIFRSTCRCKILPAFFLGKVEMKLQPPDVTSASENSCCYTTATCQRSMITADFDLHLFMLG